MARLLIVTTSFPDSVERLVAELPVVFSDAMQAGRPVIATPVGDLPDLVGRYRCGVIAGSATEQSYATALEAALTTPPKTYLDGVEAARSAFSVKSIVGRFIDMISIPSATSGSRN